MMQKSDFFFELPQGLIAQEPCEPRDAARLMCLARGTDTIEHRVFHDLPALLQAGDLLVINNSKVLPARLIGHKEPTGAVCELLLLRQVSGDVWECLAKPGKRLKTGAQVVFGDGTMKSWMRLERCPCRHTFASNWKITLNIRRCMPKSWAAPPRPQRACISHRS